MMQSTSNPSISYLNGPHNRDGGRPVTVIGNEAIRETFCDRTLEQASNCAAGPGVSRVVLNPDAHLGYGAPVGSVLVSENNVYPGPVGVDIKCSMSLLQTSLGEKHVLDPQARRNIMDEIGKRIPNGAGYDKPELSPDIDEGLGIAVLCEGASAEVCDSLGIPCEWRRRCEDTSHGDPEELFNRFHSHVRYFPKLDRKLNQLGSLGGGNHFLEGEITRVSTMRNGAGHAADAFGLLDGGLSFLTHCGSRGIGHQLASAQFKALQAKFDRWSIPYPGGDRELVYAPIESDEGQAYLADMSMGANFATVNHLLINKLIADSVEAAFPGVDSDLVYYISHNMVRREVIDNRPQLVHRKGATRAYPAGHHSLKGTLFSEHGHPILLPGNPVDGSYVMVAKEGAEQSCYSINHGAGRRLGRRQAKREITQENANKIMQETNILHNGRDYPVDESPAVYKNFEDVIDSVEEANLAVKVAKLEAIFVVKDGGKADD